jgi:subtilisin family serine protease
MKSVLRQALLIVTAAFVGTGAAAAQNMLTPPTSHYLSSVGSWGQKFPDQWGLAHVGFDQSPQSAWRLIKSDAQPVTVAVIDTGLDWNHRNIDWQNIWFNPNEKPNNGVDDDHNGYIDDVIGYDFFERDNRPWDYDGHGTMVAGIIAGSWKDPDGMAGINPFAKLMILKAVNNFGTTRTSYLAEAITYAANNGARVINLSVGGEGDASVALQAIDYAYSKGVVIVVAAGNEGVEIKNYGIAMSDKILLVGATGLDDQRLGFSNWGNISVAAPGLDILSLRARRTDTMLGIADAKYVPGTNYVGQDKRYYRASGTSFSAPFVSGLASLMIANDPTLTNQQVMNIIKSTARDVGTPGVDQFTGYGILDAQAALKAPKDYALLAGISRLEVVKKGNSQVVRVHGTADADMLKSSSLQVGAGDTPSAWTTIAQVQKSPGPDSVLGDIPATALRGSPLWQIRVVVNHDNGAAREARFRLNLK